MDGEQTLASDSQTHFFLTNAKIPKKISTRKIQVIGWAVDSNHCEYRTNIVKLLLLLKFVIPYHWQNYMENSDSKDSETFLFRYHIHITAIIKHRGKLLLRNSLDLI